MTQPTYPLIMVYNNRALYVIPTEAHLCKPLPFGHIRPSDQEAAFDSNGNKWTYQLSSNQSNYADVSFGKRLLYYMLPSPVIMIKPEWTKQGLYQLEELKQVITQCVSSGDSIITTFPDAVSLEAAINKANSFDELYQFMEMVVPLAV